MVTYFFIFDFKFIDPLLHVSDHASLAFKVFVSFPHAFYQVAVRLTRFFQQLVCSGKFLGELKSTLKLYFLIKCLGYYTMKQLRQRRNEPVAVGKNNNRCVRTATCLDVGTLVINDFILKKPYESDKVANRFIWHMFSNYRFLQVHEHHTPGEVAVALPSQYLRFSAEFRIANQC